LGGANLELSDGWIEFEAAMLGFDDWQRQFSRTRDRLDEKKRPTVRVGCDLPIQDQSYHIKKIRRLPLSDPRQPGNLHETDRDS
jgi:hypothetical protein